MKQRSILAWVVVLVLGVAFGGGGCASGEDTSATGGDGSATDGTTEAGADADAGSVCGAGKMKCSGVCVATGTDPKNCGMCGNVCPAGEVCSQGMCGLGCTGGETLCGGSSPSEAGTAVDTGTGSGDDSSTSEASAPVDSGSTGPVDAGSTAPYCSNLNNDPNNCGMCGVSCGPNHMCTNGMCSALVCPSGQQGCPASGTCIPSGTCCQSGDCTMTGQVCPMPGGMCQCPTGEKVCSVNTSCISSTACCKASDCTIAGQTCPTPGQPCKCDPSKQCCVPTDCPPEMNVGTVDCTMNNCVIAACTTGCYDVDKTYVDGCECCDDSHGHACANATSGGSLAVGGMTSFTGNIPEAAGSDWFAVTFSGETNLAFHAKVTLSNPAYVFDIEQGSCGGTPPTCGTETGPCTGKGTWETSYTGPNPPADGIHNFIPIPALGTLYIKVYRAGGAAPTTCDNYTLTISE